MFPKLYLDLYGHFFCHLVVHVIFCMIFAIEASGYVNLNVSFLSWNNKKVKKEVHRSLWATGYLSD